MLFITKIKGQLINVYSYDFESEKDKKRIQGCKLSVLVPNDYNEGSSVIEITDLNIDNYKDYELELGNEIELEIQTIIDTKTQKFRVS